MQRRYRRTPGTRARAGSVAARSPMPAPKLVPVRTVGGMELRPRSNWDQFELRHPPNDVKVIDNEPVWTGWLTKWERDNDK